MARHPGQGDEVYSRSIWQGNIEREVELGLRRDGEEFQVSFYPVKKADVPQLEVSESNLETLGF